MNTFFSELSTWNKERIEKILATASGFKIRSILKKSESSSLAPEDFLCLLAPQARENLEEMAHTANRMTRNNFGKAVTIFTPLYISDICTNQCRYCGFNVKNPHKRRHLSIGEAYLEAKEIAERGFQHILLLTGDARKVSTPEYIGAVVRKIKPLFASIGIEIYSMEQEEYEKLVEAGVDSFTMFQETYNPGLYDWLHPAGPKKDYHFRLASPERAARAGMQFIGIGALLGLDRFEYDAFATGLHAFWLQRNFPEVDISISIPRICPHEGSFEVQNEVDDWMLAQYVTALRCFLPRAAITCSSRECSWMRNNLLNLGVTRVSAGVSTAVGGRVTENLHNPGQFEISDSRSLEEMITDLRKLGFQPVLKDWENSIVT